MLLSVAGVRKSYGPDVVLKDVNLRLDRREKVALIGRNGVGKTTLLRLLTHQDEPDEGSIQLAKGASIGYLRQEMQVNPRLTVIEAAQHAFREALHLQARLNELEAKLQANPTPEEVEEYATLHERFMELEGYSATREVTTVLKQMGFAEEDHLRLAGSLSGGEKTRLALSGLLLEQPDILILDEPTNHLDLPATEWLEGWLKGYTGAVLLVSHDRTFVENVAERIVEMKNGKTNSYPGPYTKFLQLKALEEARDLELAKKQAREMAKMDEFVRRFMNSERTAQARGRLKHLEKLKERAVVIEKKDKGMKAGMSGGSRSGDIVLEVKKLSVGYAQPLISDFDWTVRRAERWGVIGENGAGKSTLIKTVLGRVESLQGVSKLGSNLRLAYFAQDVADLDLSQSPLDHLVYNCDLLPADARKLLGRFLFSGDDVFRPIGTMSGGEKNKLVLASLTTVDPNLLILDEPTNHLDIDSREALSEVLQDYRGTLILISHDRWLLTQVTDHTLDVRRDGARLFPGSYADYTRDPKGHQPVESVKPLAINSDAAMSPRELSKEIQRVSRAVEVSEQKIHALEESQLRIEARLANPSPDDDLFDLSREHGDILTSIDGAMASWHSELERLEALKAMQ